MYNKVVNRNKFHKDIQKYLIKNQPVDNNTEYVSSTYSTDIIPFDKLLNNGLPKGKIIGIGAETGIGKTTLLIQVCGNIAEKYDKNVYYIDVEGGATLELIESMGYTDLLYDSESNPNGKFYLLNMETIQQIVELIKTVSSDPDTAVIVIDSDTQVVDEKSLENNDLNASDRQKGSIASMWSKVARTLNTVIKRSNTCLILVHQARVKFKDFNNTPIVAAGGNAIKFMTSIEIWAKRQHFIDKNFKKVKGEYGIYGANIEFTVTKSRYIKPFTKAVIPIAFGRGFSHVLFYKKWMENHYVYDTQSKKKVPYLKQSGVWIEITIPSIGYKEKFRGNEKLIDFLMAYVDDIKNIILKYEQEEKLQ